MKRGRSDSIMGVIIRKMMNDTCDKGSANRLVKGDWISRGL